MIEYLNGLGNFITTLWWVWLIIAGLLIGAKCNHEQMVDTTKQYKFYGIPPATACKDSKNGHSWRRGGWNGGIYYHGAIGRTGYRCFHCGEMAFKHTDAEFIALQPEWMLQSPDCKIPERFLQYIPKEVLDKRAENIHTKHVEDLQRQKHAAIDTQKACIEELETLQLV